MKNLTLWDAVSTTPTKHTKRVKIGDREFTSINAAYMEQEATRQFGPKGIGWGIKVLEERIDQGVPVYSDKGELRGHTSNHTIKIELWFILDGKRGSIESFGCTPYVTSNRWGLHADGEAPKKSLTDATKKALTGLGFCADVYMGLFDDVEYVNHVKREERLTDAEAKHTELEKQKEEARAYFDSAVIAMRQAPTPGAAKKLYDRASANFQMRGPEYVEYFVPRLNLVLQEKSA